MRTQTRYSVTDYYTANFRASGYSERDLKTRKKKCCFCKEEFIRYGGQINYMLGKKEFCSYNCRCKYQHKLEEEENKKIREEFMRRDY